MTEDQRLATLAETATALAGELALRNVLQAIVRAATHLTGARYAALGVIGDDGRSASSSPRVSTTRRSPRSATTPAARACWAS